MNRIHIEKIGGLTVRPLQAGGWEISFSSGYVGMHHQLYLNGTLADWTDTRGQRRFWLPPCDAPRDAAVVAVAPGDRMVDFSNDSGGMLSAPPWTARRVVVRSPSASRAAKVVLLCRGPGSEQPTLLTQKEHWPAQSSRHGLGQDALGKGGFGYGGQAAPGLGKARFADGPFGFEQAVMVLEAALLQEGMNELTVGMIDVLGRQTFLPAQNVLSLPPPPPPDSLTIIGYDRQTLTLTLNIN